MIRFINRRAFSTKKDYNNYDSNVVVDYLYYKKPSSWHRLVNFVKNKNTIFDMRNNINDFSHVKFNNSVLETYRLVKKYYEDRNHSNIYDLVSKDLYTNFKTAVKKTPKNQFEMGWRLIQNPNKVQIIQARLYTVNLSKLRVIDKWFQVTCQFENESGDKVVNILEKHEKGKMFKFIKFDV